VKELRAILQALRHDSSPAVLATLVKVEGSSYRRSGARLLWRPDGKRLGSISGGCLEEDVVARCMGVLGTGTATTIIYDTTSENDLVWGVGLGCHGVVQLLLEPVNGVPAALAFAAEAWSRQEACAIAHVFRSADQPPAGAVFAVAENGAESSSPSLNSAWAQRIREMGTSCLRDGKSATLSLPDLPGAPDVFFELAPPPTQLTIFGAGDDARPLVRLATELGWEVTVIDPRAAFATPARFPEATRVIVAEAEAALARATLNPRALAVVMTHHYVHDVPLLRGLLPQPLAYLGLLGPKKRAEKILDEIAASGVAVTPAMRARLHAPVGLDLGSETPEEVALSILAEMQAVLGRRDARPLRERVKPIHS
jgi:xanthine dehydrogenase accessory factor